MCLIYLTTPFQFRVPKNECLSWYSVFLIRCQHESGLLETKIIHVTFVSNMTFMHVCILAAEVLNLKIKALDFTANRKEVLFFN